MGSVTGAALLHSALLTAHLLGVAFWIGAGAAQLYLGRRLRRARDSDLEAPLLRIMLVLDGWVVAATLTTAAAGLGLAIVTGFGFFQRPWLGAKQAIMLAVFAVVALIMPRVLRVQRAAAGLPDGPGRLPQAVRDDLARLAPWELGMRLAAVAALVLAVWRPGG